MFTFEMDSEFARKIEKLGEKSGEIAEKCLNAGGEIVYRAVHKKLISVVSPSARNGELVKSLGVTPVKRDKHGVYNLKIGFNDPREKQSASKGKRSYDKQTNAMIANVLEHGRSSRGTQPARPFMKPAVEQSERQVQETMQAIFDSEVAKL